MDSRDDRNGDEGDRETPCSCGPDCCGPGAQPGKRSRGILSLKSVVFVAVIAAAIAVAAWSLIKGIM